MVHFAEIDPNTQVVLRVIVCDSKEWCEDKIGGTWVQTYYATKGKNFAGKGHLYHPEKWNFSRPQPYPSWVLDEDCNWQPPVPYPNDGPEYEWNEDSQTWDQIYYGNI